jgi:hypothetical protein
MVFNSAFKGLNTALHYTTPTKHKVTFHKGQHINNFIICDNNTGNKSQFSSRYKHDKSITSLNTCIHASMHACTHAHMEAQTHLLTKQINKIFSDINYWFKLNQLALNYNKKHYLQLNMKNSRKYVLKLNYQGNYVKFSTYKILSFDH